MRSPAVWLCAPALSVALILTTELARATAFTAPAGGQLGLAVGSDGHGVLRAALCAHEPCDVSAGIDLGVPPEFRPSVANARLTKLSIGKGRRAIVATVPGKDGRAFEAVIVAPLAGSAPKIVFADVTGLSEGADGVRQGKSVMISAPDDDGARSITVGLRREDLDLCGRAALLAPQVLSADDLALHAAKVQRLSADERARAPSLQAAPLAADAPGAPDGVLRATGASSALGSPAALTDGRAASTWAEARGGSGRGEFVVMNAPAQLPLTGFEFALAPADAKLASPRELWLATRSQLFHVELPASAARAPDARFRVTLPKPVQSDCVALVLESAFDESKDARVGLAELRATTELSSADPAALFAALAGGAERAEAAGALLRALGGPGFAAVAKGFSRLDEGGRRVALDVIDGAPCDVSVPVYVDALLGPFPAQRTHAEEHLRRCGRASAAALVARFDETKGADALTLAGELALVAPELAVEHIAPRMLRVSARERRELRVILARASSAPEARASVAYVLADSDLPTRLTLELLRALGPRASTFLPQSAQALARVARDRTFATRYLALEPASVIAPTDAGARSVLANALTDAHEPRLRTRALEVLPRDASWTQSLVSALADPEVRVREAAAHAVRDGRVAAATPKLLELLDEDAWPIVRGAAAQGLAVMPPEPRVDRALIVAVKDDAPLVRAAAIRALGARGVTGAAEPLREKLADKEERFEVRQAAATALGALCDAASADALTKLSARLADPLATADERALADTALDALLVIGPPDLESRLAPLRSAKRGPSWPALMQRAARAKSCGARATAR